jgi:histidinol-phosphate aminotransferase
MAERNINRRDWLKAGALMSAGLSFGLKLDASSHLVQPNLSFQTGEWVGDYLIDAPLKAKLNANENPYGQSKKAKEAYIKEFEEHANLYGSGLGREFRSFMAKDFGVSDSNVILSAGSMELLQLTALSFGLDKGNMISAFPTFENLLRNAEAVGCDWKQVDVNGDLIEDLAGMESAIDDNTGLMYICNPNNPTGTLQNPDELREFCKRVSKRVPVFVDEAYNEFLDPKVQERHSMIDLVKEGYDVIICKTFSKLHGFAGLRVGYAVGNEKLIAKMKKFRNSMTTMSRPAMKGAMASYEDKDFSSFCRKKTADARFSTTEELKKRGYEPSISVTSFMVFPIKMRGDQYIQAMADQGVGIRSWEFKDQQWCRVSIGTLDEMKEFLKALDKVKP